ncbi:MAG: hypothetical protein HQL31_09925 [Planctomycetes bacterium]|nr:hypothetical protein [Planctomycetota bacterium]
MKMESACSAVWLARAEELKPLLLREEILPRRLVRVRADPAAFQGWRVDADAMDLATSRRTPWAAGETRIYDLGEHRVGRLRLSLASDAGFNDAPVRLRILFAEVPAELAEPFGNVKGWLSCNWLQDEQVTFDLLPCRLELPRRYACRYIRIEAVGASQAFRVLLPEISFEAVAAVAQEIAPLVPTGLTEEDHTIALASLRTLRDCMQTVFEDGPKRDRRLWIGDLRLQALANAVSFRHFGLVRRCLYLFAGLAREDGMVPSCLYEDPAPRSGGNYAQDYAALFGVVLADHVDISGDEITGRELLPVAVRQIELLLALRDASGSYREADLWWFIDWQNDLHKQPCIHGVVLYALNRVMALAKALGQPEAVAGLVGIGEVLRAAARRAFLGEGALPRSSSGQASWASWAWLTMAGVLDPEEASAGRRGRCAPVAPI